MISRYTKHKLKYLQENSKKQASQLSKIENNNSLIIRDFDRQNIDSNIYKNIVDLSIDWIELEPLIYYTEVPPVPTEWMNSVDFIIEGIHEDMIHGIKIDHLIKFYDEGSSDQLLSDSLNVETTWNDYVESNVVKTVEDLEDQSPYKTVKFNITFYIGINYFSSSMPINPKIKVLIKLIPTRTFI